MKWLNKKWDAVKYALDPRPEGIKLLCKISKELTQDMKKNSINCSIGSVLTNGVITHFPIISGNNATVANVLTIKSVFKNVADKHGYEYIDIPAKDILENNAKQLCISLKL